MPLVHVLHRARHCGETTRWVWEQLTTRAAAALPRVTKVVLTTTIACGTSFIPPVGAVPPPALPDHGVTPPGYVYVPIPGDNVAYAPGGGWGFLPPVSVPWTPPVYTVARPPLDHRHLRELCDLPPLGDMPGSPPLAEAPVAPVPEPLPLAVTGVALLGLGLSLTWRRRHEPR